MPERLALLAAAAAGAAVAAAVAALVMAARRMNLRRTLLCSMGDKLLEDTARQIEESEGAEVANMLMADVRKVLEPDRQREPAWFEDDIKFKNAVIRVTSVGIGTRRVLQKRADLSTVPVFDMSKADISDVGACVLATLMRDAPPKGSLLTLTLASNGITDLGAKMIADAIGGGAVPNLEKLQVQFNLIEDPGCVALAEAISTGKVPKLKTFRINHNAIGDEGIAAIAEALESSKAPPIEELWLQGMKQVKGPGVKALGDVLARGCASTVHTVYLYEDQVDDEGAIAMAQALGSGKLPKMKELWLNDNRVSDATATALAAALKTGATPKLVQLKLMTNPSITEAGIELLREAMQSAKAPRALTINTDLGNVVKTTGDSKAIDA